MVDNQYMTVVTMEKDVLKRENVILQEKINEFQNRYDELKIRHLNEINLFKIEMKASANAIAIVKTQKIICDIVRLLNEMNDQIDKGLPNNKLYPKNHIEIKNTFDRNIKITINMLENFYLK